MKNEIIIRLENTLFNTSNVSNHLPVAKDRERYLATALPKCRINPAFPEPLAFLESLRSMGRPVSLKIITGFRGEPVWKLLSAHGLAGARVFLSAGRALAESGGNPVLISADPKDLEAAETAGVPSSGEISSPGDVLRAFGVRKSTPWKESRAA